MSYFKCKNKECIKYNKRFEEPLIINGEKRCPVCEKKQIKRIRPFLGAGNIGDEKELEYPVNKN